MMGWIVAGALFVVIAAGLRYALWRMMGGH